MLTSNSKISICIPTYEMNGCGYIFLEHSFKILTTQTFKNFDIVISDHSKNNLIKNLCNKYKDELQIKYYRNPLNIGNSSANINNAIKKANGKLIKILFQDDFLFNNQSLENINNNFDLEKDYWLATACQHSLDGKNFFWKFFPKYNHAIHLGENTISSPSVITIKNDNPLLFDEKLLWLMDCDYYKRCYNKYGAPKILDIINVINRIGPHQISQTSATRTIRGDDYEYILKKYNETILLKRYKERLDSKYPKLTPKIFVQKATRKILRILSKFWTFLFLKRMYKYKLTYFFYNSTKYFYKISEDKDFPKSAKKVLFIYSKRHFDPEERNQLKLLSLSSTADLARNIHGTLVENGKEVVYVDQKEYIKNLGSFDLIISILCKNFVKYANDNPNSKKILFLVNAHPLYRLKALIKECFKFHKKLPLGEYVSPIIFFNSLRKANKLILIGNDFVKNTYIKYGIDKNKINLINSGVNSDILVPKRDFLSKDTIKIVFSASDIGIRKGLFRMIDIWEKINKESNKKLELTMLGGTGSFKKEIEDFTSKHSNVTCWGWVDSTDPVYKVILQSNHLVFSFSVEEGQVGCILEAMACGCIPVITEESGVPLIDGKDGIIIKSNQFNSDIVTKKIIELINNKENLEKFSLNARNYIMNNHSWDEFKNNFIKLI